MTGKFKKPIALIIVFMMILSANIGSYATIIENGGPGDSLMLEEQKELPTDDLLVDEEAPKSEEVPKSEEELLQYSIEYLIKDTEEPVPGLEVLLGEGKVGDLIELDHPKTEGYKVLENQPTDFILNENPELNKIVVYYFQDLISKGTTLKVNHFLLLENGEEELLESEEITDLIIGSIVYGDEFALNKEFEFLSSEPKQLELKQEDNVLKLSYGSKEEMGENPDGLSGPEYIDAPYIEEYEPGSLGPFKDEMFGRMMKSMQTLSYPGDHDNIEPPAPGSLNIDKFETPTSNPNQWRIDLTLTGKDIPSTSDIVLVIDRSGSMGTSGRMGAAKTAAEDFVNTLLADVSKAGTRIAIVSFAGDVTSHGGFKDYSNKSDLISAINGLNASGGTFIQAGLRQASTLLNGSTADKKSIVLLGDGAATYSYKIDNPNNYLESWYSSWGTTYKRTNSNIPENKFIYGSTVGSGNSDHYEYESGWSYSNNYRHGASTIAEAGFAKAKGYTMYTVALDAGTEGDWTLDGIANSGNAYTASPSDLQNIFQTIAGSLSYAATDATITDPMGPMFSIPGINSSNFASKINVNRGTLSWNDTTETITWHLNTISEGNPATMWYIVEINNSAVSGQVYPTNEHTYVDYENALKNGARKTFPMPEVGINAGTIKIHYYRVNSVGQPINSTGNPITKEQAELQVLTYPTSPLLFNTPYTVTGPGAITVGTTDYQYNGTGNVGDNNPVDVILLAANPSAHVWFAYEEVKDVTVTYTTDGNGTINGITTQTIHSGGNTIPVTAEPNSGYYFVKWDDNNTNPTRHEENVTANAIYTAIFTPKQALTVTANSNSKDYDGTPLTDSGHVLTGTLASGDIISVTVVGTITNAGSVANEVTEVKVMNGTTDVTANYNINLVDGTLTVNKKAVTITSESENFTYDGNSHTNAGYVVAGLVGSDNITATVSGTITYPTQSPVTNEVTEHSFTVGDATNYTVSYVNGSLTMGTANIDLTVTANSNSKDYDGTPLTDSGHVLTGTLASGDIISVTVVGTITNAGSVANEVTEVKVMNGTTDVTANYNINPVDGTLTVNKKAVTITSESENFTYDGKSHTNAGYVVAGLVGSDNITATVSGTITYPTQSPVTNEVTEHSFTAGDATNYTVSYVDGSLTMNTAQLTVTVIANSGTKEYTGAVQSVIGYEAPVGLLAGHTLSGITASGAGTNVGNYPVTFTGTPVIKDANDVDVTQNYAVTLIDGNLFIWRSELTVEKSADKESFSELDEKITYTYVVTNTGNVIIDGPFTIVDDKISTIDMNSAPSMLLSGGSFQVTAEYEVTQADLDAGLVTNVVTVTGTFEDEDVTGTDEETVPGTQLPKLEIFKTGTYEDFNEDQITNVGDKINYTITVKNTGNTTLTNVVVKDEMLGLETTVATIAVGTTWTHTQAYEITQADIDTGKVLNTVLVNDQPKEVTTPLTKSPSLTISKEANKSKFNTVGEVVTYTITVINTGNITLTGISVTDPLIELTGPVGDKNENGKLDVGETWIYTGDYTITAEDMAKGTVTNLATVETEETEPTTDTVTIGKNSTSYIVKYLQSGTNVQLNPQKNGSGIIGATITESAISISGYSVLTPTTVTIELKPTGNEITFLYSKRIIPNPEPSDPEPSDSEPFIPVDKEEIIDEPIAQALPELNKEDHFQYIQGYPDNTVRPEGLISREEVAAVFFRLLTEGYRDSIRTFDHNFPDVAKNRWSAKHIATLAKGGIIKGYEDGSFRAGNFITRAELATIASRFDNLSPFEANSFSDISGHWANKYINSASAKGWVNGYPDGSFKPDQYITRAEFVTLVNNVLERRVHKEDILAESRKFPDLKETKWYYEAMQESINSHHIERMDDSYEEWIDIYYPMPEM